MSLELPQKVSSPGQLRGEYVCGACGHRQRSSPTWCPRCGQPVTQQKVQGLNTERVLPFLILDPEEPSHRN